MVKTNTERGLWATSMVTGSGSLGTFILPYTPWEFAHQHVEAFKGAGAGLFIATVGLWFALAAVRHHNNLPPDMKLPLRSGQIIDATSRTSSGNQGNTVRRPIRYC